MDERKTGKLRNIKETASDAVKIMHQISSPGVLESLNKVKETANIVNEIIQSLSTTAMVRNIENFRLISENMNEASTKMQNTVQQLRETGVIEEGTALIKSAKGKINSFGGEVEGSITGQDLHEVSDATKEMLVSIKDLMIELKETTVLSKQSRTIRNIKETFSEVTDIYKTVA